MWHIVVFVTTDVSEEGVVPIFRVEKIRDGGEHFSSLAYLLYPEEGVDTFLRNVCCYKITRRHIPEGGILHSLRREMLISYNNLSQ
jgi:hypothetical protein